MEAIDLGIDLPSRYARNYLAYLGLDRSDRRIALGPCTAAAVEHDEPKVRFSAGTPGGELVEAGVGRDEPSGPFVEI